MSMMGMMEMMGTNDAGAVLNLDVRIDPQRYKPACPNAVVID